MAPDLTRTVLRIVLIVVAVVAALYFVYLISEVIAIVLVSIFLAVALAPAVDFLDRDRIPRWLAILVVYFWILAALAGLGALIAPPIVTGANDFVDNVPRYADDLKENKTFKKYDDEYSIVDEIKKAAPKLGEAADVLRDVTIGVFTRLIELFTVLVITFILLLDGRRFVRWIFRELPPDKEARARDVVAKMHRAIGGYVLGNFAISIIAGVITYATLEILNVPFAAPLAVLMAFFDLIPLVGATIGGLLIAIVASFADFPTAPIVWLIVLIVYQQIENHLVQPLIYGKTVQLHPLLVIVSILIGATLLGILGALLAIPAAAVIQIGFKDWWEHRRVTETPVIEPAGGT